MQNLKPYDNPFWCFEQRYQEEEEKKKKKHSFPLVPMGVLAPESAHKRPSAQPINPSGNFPAHMSAESPLNISPNSSKVISEVSEP
jgi:hypothetical protein